MSKRRFFYLATHTNADTTHKRGPEPIIEVDALIDRATDLRVSRIEPPALVILGRDVGGDGLALAEGEVTLLK